jgi:5-methyltetrahydropteroyltriglutamate--homocysteine methyltransferase
MKKKAPLSPGQKKLEALGVSFPSLPLTLVGPLPKHDDLKELRYRVSKKVQQASDLERKEKLSIDLWIREQEKLGINAFVEGGMTRNDMITHFAERIDGFVPGGFTRCFGNSYYHRPIIAQKLAWRGPITADAWHYTQRLTHKPLKAIVTGPYTLMDWEG